MAILLAFHMSTEYDFGSIMSSNPYNYTSSKIIFDKELHFVIKLKCKMVSIDSQPIKMKEKEVPVVLPGTATTANTIEAKTNKQKPRLAKLTQQNMYSSWPYTDKTKIFVVPQQLSF